MAENRKANVSGVPRNLKTNPGGFEHPEQKVEFLLTIRGILKKIFGDLHNYLFFDKEAEFCLQTLTETYGYKDAKNIFPRVVNEKRVMATLETVFRFAKLDGQGTEVK